jgi:hypothetical protein
MPLYATRMRQGVGIAESVQRGVYLQVPITGKIFFLFSHRVCLFVFF